MNLLVPVICFFSAGFSFGIVVGMHLYRYLLNREERE